MAHIMADKELKRRLLDHFNIDELDDTELAACWTTKENYND